MQLVVAHAVGTRGERARDVTDLELQSALLQGSFFPPRGRPRGGDSEGGVSSTATETTKQA